MDSAKEIILVEDDYLIREVIKKVVYKIDPKFKVFTSGNGVEGLGIIFVQNPSLIILDTSLPKYSGMELVNFIESNIKLTEINDIPLILIYQNNKIPTVEYSNCIKISKTDPEFLNKIETAIALKLTGSTKLNTKTLYTKLINSIASEVVLWSNISDSIVQKITLLNLLLDVPLFVLWILSEVITSFYFVLYGLFSSGFVKDNNLDQHSKDLDEYRIRYYPSAVGFITSLILLVVQFTLIIIGGSIIFSSSSSNRSTDIDTSSTSVQIDAIPASYVYIGDHNKDLELSAIAVSDRSEISSGISSLDIVHYVLILLTVALIVINLFTYPGSYLLLLPWLKFNRTPWGIIFDAHTKLPLAFTLVKLYDQNNNLLKTILTGFDGKYGFTVKPGRYLIEIKNSEYQMQKIEINFNGEQIIKDIGLKSLNGLDTVTNNSRSNLKLNLKKINWGIIITGLFFGVIAVALLVSELNIAFLVLYLILICFLIIFSETKKYWGYVYETANYTRLAGALIRVFSSKGNKLIDAQIADPKGCFGFNMDEGVYNLLIQAEDYRLASMVSSKYNIFTSPSGQTFMQVKVVNGKQVNITVPMEKIS